MLTIGVFAQNSILSSGTWHKIGLVESGIYKIDPSFIASLGLSPEQINPENLRLFGYGGGMLPQPNEIDRPNDPNETALLGFGVEDGSFDDGDYFLFYGDSPDLLTFEQDSLIFSKNLYSDTTYYFLTVDSNPGLRIINQTPLTSAGPVIDSYFHPITHEIDENNILASGREWFGEKFSSSAGLSRSFEYPVEGFLGEVRVYVEVVAATEGPASFDILLNGNNLGNLEIDSIRPGTYSNQARENAGFYVTSPASLQALDLSIVYNRHPTALTSIGYLDLFTMGYQRQLGLYGDQTRFWNQTAEEIVSYQLTNASGAEVWDISDPNQPKIVTASDGIYTSSGQDFIVFSGSDFPRPQFFHKVLPQNLKSNVNFDALIVTHPAFLSLAEELAQFHEEHDGLTVQVVTVNEIYNEFSSGRQDISAIRDYIRFVWTNGSEKLQYVLLYGDGSYDYKNRVAANTNYVPIYESRESFHSIYSHSSDDFFGFMEEHEGEWIEDDDGDHTLEIGIGRLPVKSRLEAQNMNNKIFRYVLSERSYGEWRNNLLYLADDGDNNIHMRHGEQLNALIDTSNVELNVRKIYLDAFNQDLEDNEKSPEMQQALIEQLEVGALVMDYMGHGNEFGLMQEGVINTSFIQGLENRHKLPLFVTATCQFGKYDNPLFNSGAELMLLNENGGAIALLTTTRAVFAHTNLPLNEAFHRHAFQVNEGTRPRLGDIIKNTKNESLRGPVNRNFALLGDPMLTLNYPDYHITFDQFTDLDTLKALQEVSISGKIKDINGALINSFNGSGTMTLWDIPQDKVTKGQQSNAYTYTEQTNALFRGEIEVVNGTFQTQLIIPKNTSYRFEKGKINAYVFDDQNVRDATGGSNNVILGGSVNNGRVDNQPPEIDLFVNESAYRDGMSINQNSLFIAQLSDESGINISSNGFNQNLTLTLGDGLTYILNDYYTASAETFTKGAIVFPLENVPAGEYRGELKVWDVYNNSSSKTVHFRVSDQPQLNLFNINSYPNPVSKSGTIRFSFEHDREGDALEVRTNIFDMMGNLVEQHHLEIDDSERITDDLFWQPGESLDVGIYILRLEVRSKSDGAQNQAIKRLVIIN